MILKTADQVDQYAALEELAGTFRRSERDEFISYVWGQMFAQYDTFMPTAQAVDSANHYTDFAGRVWDEVN